MDTIGNMLTKIRNAYRAHHTEVSLPISSMNQSIIDVLVNEHYLKTAKITSQNKRSFLTAELIYQDHQPAIASIRRVSTPGRRVYTPVKRLPKPKQGIGTIILSTPKGVMTARAAREANTGGEVLCEVIRGDLL